MDSKEESSYAKMNILSDEMSYFIGLVEPKMIICEEKIIETIRKGLVGSGHEAPIWTFTKSEDVEVRSVDELMTRYDQESTYT